MKMKTNNNGKLFDLYSVKKCSFMVYCRYVPYRNALRMRKLNLDHTSQIYISGVSPSMNGNLIEQIMV